MVRPKLNFSRRFYRLLVRVKVFYNKLPEPVKNLLEFLEFVIEYGILISTVMYFIFMQDINLGKLVAYGIVYYFIVYEVRAIIRMWKS